MVRQLINSVEITWLVIGVEKIDYIAVRKEKRNGMRRNEL